MRYCVTGADGFLGRGIVSKLLDSGVEVVASGLSLEGIDGRAERIEGNIFDFTDPYSDLGRPDVLLHLAWRDGFDHKSTSHMEDLPKHCHFISEFAKSPISRICSMGSMHEIGYYEGPVTSNTPCFPESDYGIAKNALRDYTFMVTKESGINCLWLRGFYIVDGSLHGCSIFSKITQANLAGQAEFPFTSGKNLYDFLDYKEFCEMVVASITQSRHTGIVNICSGNPESLAARVERFIADEGMQISLKYNAYPDRPYDSPGIWGDPLRIQTILNEWNGD